MDAHKNGEATDQPIVDQPPAVVVGQGKRHLFKKPHRPHLSKKAVWLSLVSLLGVLIIAGLIYTVWQHVTNKTITVGQTKITEKQIKSAASALSNFSSRSHESFGPDAATTVQNDLMLNAALKDVAPKYHVTVTQADIDAYLKDQYDHYGSKAAYQQYVNSTGIANEIKIRNENTVYESKLQNDLLGTKQLFDVGIYYDTPYTNSKSATDQATLRAQAVQTMKSKFLPLFNAGETKEQIAAQTQINYLTTEGNDTTLHLLDTGMPTVADYVTDYTSDPAYFNDAQADTSIPGLVSTNGAANKLTKVGDTTGVITAKAGWIGIMRLEGTKGGAYGSWDAFLKSYKQQHNITNIQLSASYTSVLGHGLKIAVSPVARAYDHLASTVTPPVLANNGIDCSGHVATFDFKAVDQITGGGLSGMLVTENRSDFGPDCPKSAGYWTGSDKTDSNGNATLIDNCYRPAPDSFSLGSISGYTRTTPKPDIPSWKNGSVNDHGAYHYTINFMPSDNTGGSVTVTCAMNSAGKPVYTFDYTFSDPDGNKNGDAAGYIVSSPHRSETPVNKNTLGYTSAPSPYTRGHGSYTSVGWPGDDITGHHVMWLIVANIHPQGGHDWVIKNSVGLPPSPCTPAPPTTSGGGVTVSCTTLSASAVTNSSKTVKGLVIHNGSSGSYRYPASGDTGSSSVSVALSSIPGPTPVSTNAAQTYYVYTLYTDGSQTSPPKSGTSPSNCASTAGVCSNITGPVPAKAGVYRVGVVLHVGSNADRYPQGSGSSVATDPGTSYLQYDINPVTADAGSGNNQIASGPVSFTVYYIYSSQPGSTNNTGTITHVVGPTVTRGPCGSPPSSCTTCDCSDSCPLVPPTPFGTFNIFGADVAVGTCFEGVNSMDATADLKGLSTPSGSGYSAISTVGLGAIATGDIANILGSNNLASDGGSGTGANFKKLTFSNQGSSYNVSDPGQAYGGSYGNIGCVPDYYGNATRGHSAVAPPAIVDINSLPDGLTSYDGNITLIDSRPLANSRHITLAVKGTVTIASNVSYAPYGNISLIPRFNLLVKGDIKVNATVDTLHGFYAAEPTTGTSTDGIFDSCAAASGACTAKQLTVYGAVTANTVSLNRVVAATSGTTETVQYSPELWLSGATTPSGPLTVGNNWLSVTSLPPVL